MPRRPAAGGQGAGQSYTFSAPARGWVETDSPVRAKSAGASVLENFLPTPNGNRLRGGSQSVSQIGAEIVALFPYDNGVDRKLFAATAGAIKDASRLDASAAPTVVSSFTGADPVGLQFTTIGKTYLCVLNGTEAPALFDGSSWQRVTSTSTPINISGTGDDRFSHGWVFKSRLFFVVANSMKVWSLPVGQVGGEATDLNLSGVFQKGGRVLFGTTWTADSGAGFGDRCVIVTDRGEIAIFEGTNPGDAAQWSLVGRYEIAPPLGINAHAKVGGDVLIATTQGLLPLSGVVSKDPLAVDGVAISRPISKSWTRRAAEGDRWRVSRWDSAGVILVTPAGSRNEVWGVFAQTGAWFKITGWDMRAVAMHGNRLYFGGRDGFVKQADTTGRDDGRPFTGRFRGLLEQAPRLGLKTVRLARAWFNTTKDIRCSLGFATPLSEFASPPEPWSPVTPSSGWDLGLWNRMRWDQGDENMHLASTQWRAVGVTGQMVAPEVQVVSDADLPSVCELIAVDSIIEVGGVVV